MGKNTKIEWAHHTFNPWWGCQKVSEACRYCYAEGIARRFEGKLWGPTAPRRFASEEQWAQPLRWHDRALKTGRRQRVFSASMSDVFERLPEGHPDEDRMAAARQRLFELSEATPKLDWMLLTKRPHEVAEMAPWSATEWPTNVWVGATIESQSEAEKRLLHLMRIPAPVRFISCEPLLGSVSLSCVLLELDGASLDALAGLVRDGAGETVEQLRPIDWVICGGESGAHARPTDPRWLRYLRDECAATAIPFFFKQWGSWSPDWRLPARRRLPYDRDTGRVRLAMAGKKHTGRELFGRRHEELPRQLTLESSAA